MRILLLIFVFSATLATWRVNAQDSARQADQGQLTAARKPLPPNTDGGEHFLSDRERGWSWYETHPIPPPPPVEPPPSPDGKPSTTEPPTFSVAWLRVHLEEAKIKAIDNPTRDNVEYFSYLQKITMDRAEKFARMVQTVNTLNPTLDETIENPVTSYARAARRDVTSSDRKRVLSALGGSTGIFYFFKSDCPYCAKQSPLLMDMQKLYGFKVMPVSLDQKPLQNGAYPNWIPDQGQGVALNITSTPTLYLFKPPHQLVLLSVGLQTEPDLETKILTSAHAHQWLNDADFELAVRGSTRNFLVDAANDLPDVDWNDPAKALEALRTASHRAIEVSTTEGKGSTAFEATPWTGQ